jgi:hypothetical protein
MKTTSWFASLLSILFLASPAATAKEKEKAATVPIRWAYVTRQADVEARPAHPARKPANVRLQRGELVQVLGVKSKGASSSTKIGAVDPSTFEAVTGWVNSSSIIERGPNEPLPSDDDLLKLLGGRYLEDLTASTIAIARYVVQQGNREPVLLCFLGSRVLPQTRLQIFERTSGHFTLGPYLEFPASEMLSAITRLEVLDLLGDGDECIVTEEPFNTQPEEVGENMVIRRVEGNALETLWRAPLEFRNLSAFPPQINILKPPEKNIGSIGTVTSATVEFRTRGSVREPAWKGKIEFHVLGREEPVDTIKTEKMCPWNGSKFAPLR